MASRSRLTLSTVGIKSPLDIAGAEQPRPAPSAAENQAPAPQARQRRQPRSAATPIRQADAPAAAAQTDPEPPFYGTGRPLQTSIALDENCVSRLEELSRAAGISVNALAIAALQAALPATGQAARKAIVSERVDRAGGRTARMERNLRLPKHLRVRIDELVSGTREQLPRATRADLINAAIRSGLPPDAERARELVAAHARRLELTAA
jgi:hypothetical protein